jgi:hypothetical protein
MKPIILLVGILFFLNSCSDDNSKTTLITFTEIGKGTLGGKEKIEKANMVINNENDWQKLITKMNSTNKVSNSFSETDINFNSYLIIAVFLEVKNNGWSVEITNIIENDNDLVVSTNETEFANSVITQAFCIVKIPTTKKTIIFK